MQLSHLTVGTLTQVVHVPDHIFVFEEHVFVSGLQVFRQAVHVTLVQQVQEQYAGHPEGHVGQLVQARHLAKVDLAEKKFVTCCWLKRQVAFLDVLSSEMRKNRQKRQLRHEDVILL